MISPDVVENISNLAKLKLSDEDIKGIAELIEIMNGIEKIDLNEGVDLLNLELTNTYREDIARPSLSREQMLSPARHIRAGVEAGCISVPIKIREE